MPNPVVTWVLELNPSDKTTFELTNVADLKITNATLDPILQDETGRSTVILHIMTPKMDDSEDDDEDSEDASDLDFGEAPPQKLVLTSLTPGKIESTVHDIVVTRPARVVCEVIGKNTIHLSGYLYVPDGEGSDSDDEYTGIMGTNDDSDESEEDYMDEMERDIELDASEMGDMADEMLGRLKDSGRFEEVDSNEEEGQKAIEAPKQAPKKRARESDDEEMAPKLSKKERKRLKAEQAAAEASGEKKADAPPQKKQKAEGGKAVPVSTGKETQPNGAAAPAKKEKEKVSGEKKGKEKNGTDKKETAAGEPVQHPNGLIITDTKLGTGATAKKGSRLGMRYIGKLSNGTVFDSNTSGKPLKFQLGKGEVIKGWDEGLVGMKIGGERRLVIPPKLAYGKQKTAGIPPNSTLTFEVKLLEVS